MPRVFKNTDEMVKYLTIHAEKVLQDVIDSYVIPRLMEKIQTVVYDAYTPGGKSPYERRGSRGGLGDINNVVTTSDKGDGYIKIRVRNEANAVNSPMMLDVIITEGTHYDWERSAIYYNQPFPRDFYTETVKVVKEELPRLIEAEFRKRGFNFKYAFTIR